MIALRNETRRIGKRLTTAQYLALPDDGRKYELFEGELVMSPSYFFPHGVVVGAVFERLRRHVKRRSLGVVGMDTDVVFVRENTVLRPDICFIAERRRSIIRGHIYGPPDFVIEVTSPNNWQNDVHFKRMQYERFGVREYWVLDIADGRNRAFQWLLRRGELIGGQVESATIRSRVVEGFSLRLNKIWQLASEGAP